MSAVWKPRGISLSAGGIRVLGHIGVIARLREEKLLDDVINWYGCSGGAMCAFFGILGCSPEWLRNGVRYFNGSVITELSDDLVANFMTSWGVTSGESYRDIIGKFADTWEPGASLWTFADLSRERPGKSLHLAVLNVSQQRYEVFNAETTPTLRIIDAILASSSIPLVFVPWRSPLTGDLYCDGGVIEQFPWKYVADHDSTLVIACSDADIRDRPLFARVRNLGEYFTQIFSALRRNILTSIPAQPRHWIAVNNQTVGMLDVRLTEEGRLEFFDEGVTAAAGWIAFMRDTSSRKHEENLRHGPYHAQEQVCLHLPAQTSDNHLPETSTLSAYPPQNLRQDTSRRHPSRRWSL
jgi:predicted acylesterase/phospholipase RssA